MNKRAAVRTLSSLSSAALLAGGFLGQSAFAGTSQSNVVNITFWNGHPSGSLQAQMHAEVAQFNKTHPKIHVTYTDKYAKVQDITAAMTAGDAPNVAMPHLDWAQQFAQDGYLLNLTPFIRGSGTHGITAAQLKQDYYPSVWARMSIAPGKQYILPYEENGQMVIYYNANLLRKAGIKAPPHTWSQVVADAKKVTVLGSQYHGIAWTPSLTQWLVIVKDYGGQIFANNKDTKFALDNKGALAALNMLRSMVANKTMELTQNYDYQLDFGTGDVGMLIEQSAGWTYDYQSAGGKFKMMASPAPAGPSGQAFNYVTGDTLCVLNVGTPAQKLAAWTFVKWLSSPQVNAEWNENTNYLPTGPKSASLMTDFYKKNPNYKAAFSNPVHWLTDPAANATQYYAAENAMNDDFYKALMGQESTAQALKNMNTIGNEYLSGQQRS